jgi:L-2-hydroxyglutarate oxidase LhgO
MTGASPDPQIVPFRGDYWRLRPGRQTLVRGLIYPVPDPSFPFLGVHFTTRMDGDLWLGPNAVLAFAREGYRLSTVRVRELLAMLCWPGLYRMSRRYLRTGLGEMYRAVSHRALHAQLQRYVPDLQPEDIIPGPSGVRAQALSRSGALIDDFVFSREEGVLHVRNAPSPAATSCLAIARQIADRFADLVPDP